MTASRLISAVECDFATAHKQTSAGNTLQAAVAPIGGVLRGSHRMSGLRHTNSRVIAMPL